MVKVLVPEEEEGPIDQTKQKVNFESIVKSCFYEVALIDEVDDWLSDKEYNPKDY